MINDEFAIRKIINNQGMINGYFSIFVPLLKSDAKGEENSCFARRGVKMKGRRRREGKKRKKGTKRKYTRGEEKKERREREDLESQRIDRPVGYRLTVHEYIRVLTHLE